MLNPFASATLKLPASVVVPEINAEPKSALAGVPPIWMLSVAAEASDLVAADAQFAARASVMLPHS